MFMSLLIVVSLVLTAGIAAAQYQEAPSLAELVAAGELPPVEERLPLDPEVIEPVEEIGQYGGTWNRAATGMGDVPAGFGRLTHTSLVKWGRDGMSLEPEIASSWDVSEDNTTFTFHLREGIRWSDGAPFGADDFVFWYDNVVRNEQLTPVAPAWLTINGELAEVTKIDDHTVEFSFVGPYGLFQQYLAFLGHGIIQPKHYLSQFHPDYVAQDELDAMVADAGLDEWYQLFQNKNNVNTNPERPVLSAWVLQTPPPSDRLIFVRNPYYFKVDPDGNQLPYIDRIAINIVGDTEILNLQASAGQIDMQFRHIAFSNWTLFMENQDEGDYRVLTWHVGESGPAVFPNQTMNPQNPRQEMLWELMQDIRFRQALSMGVDRSVIDSLLYFGMSEPVESVLLPRHLQDEDFDFLQYYRFNPDRANELLDEMGLERNAQGLRLDPNGDVLRVTIEGLAPFPSLIDAFEIVSRQWEENLGIRTDVDALSYDRWWPRMHSAEYHLVGYLMGVERWPVFPQSFAPVEQSNYWAPEHARYYITGGRAGQQPSAPVAEIQRLYDELKAESDPDEVLRLESEIMLIVAENVFNIPFIGSYPQPVIVKNNFRNVPESGINVYMLFSPAYTSPEQYFIRQ